jgi:molybdopterin synthase sulfur carrier subunit
MRVEVRLFGEFREAVGKPAIALDLAPGTTCAEALRKLVELEPKLRDLLFSGGALRDHLHVFVNGQNVNHREGVNTRLADGDALTFFTPISGG